MRPKKVEALVLCVDRDDDLGKKAGVRGPVIGEEANFDAARALALADPEESDVNAIYAAVKVKRESEHLYKGVEVVTLTGDKEVGVKSDQKIGNQLVRLLDAYKPKGVILVTDGAEDDEVMPIIQSETKILSVKNVTVKQARPLESAYFKLQDFFHRIAENPHQARLLFGLPGALLLLIVLLSFFGIPIVEAILIMLAIYLLAKGFGYDEQLFSGLSEVKESLLQGNIYRVFNILAVLLLVFCLVTGYLQLKKNLVNIYRPGSLANPSSVWDAIGSQPLLAANFMLFSRSGIDLAAMDLMLIAFSLVAIGFMVHNFLIKDYLKIKRYTYILLFVALVKYISSPLYWAIIFLNSESTTITIEGFDPLQNLLISLLVSFVAVLVVHYLLKIVFFDYISRKKRLEKRYVGQEVLTKKGKKLGRVTGIVMRGADVKGLQIKKRFFPMKDVQDMNKVIVVSE